MSGEWTLERVAQEIRKNADKRIPIRTVLLVGAGCSFQAGIPLARGFVDEIKARFPDAFDRAAEKTYPVCMGELSASDRHDLISEYIDKAKINWANRMPDIAWLGVPIRCRQQAGGTRLG